MTVPSPAPRGALGRWLRFNSVGGLGIVVQMAVLALLLGPAGLHYLVATLLAVECTLLHNFAWHERWTWRERATGGGRTRLGRLARFHAANGAVSLAGNALLMAALVELGGTPPLLANGLTIVACSTINFFLGDRFVFAPAEAERRCER